MSSFQFHKFILITDLAIIIQLNSDCQRKDLPTQNIGLQWRPASELRPILKFTLSIAIWKRQILCWPNIDTGGKGGCRDGFILAQNAFFSVTGIRILSSGWVRSCAKYFSLFTKIIPGLSPQEKCDFRLIVKIFMKVFECSMHKRLTAFEINGSYRYRSKKGIFQIAIR